MKLANARADPVADRPLLLMPAGASGNCVPFFHPHSLGNSIPLLDGQFGRHQFCADMSQFIDLDVFDVDSRAIPE